MRKAEMTCHRCGMQGHFEAECPNTGIDNTSKPIGCGYCDETTRLVDLGDKAGRCTVCHPLRGKQLKQHRKCPHCHVTVYEFDHNQCGNHAGPEVPDKRPDRQHIEQIVSAT